MMKNQRLVILAAVATIGVRFCFWPLGSVPSLNAARPLRGNGADVGANGDWRLSKDTTISLVPSDTEGRGGVIRWRRARNSVAWETSYVARSFGSPCLLGSFPDQLVVLPYHVGGGTGSAEHRWVLIDMQGRKPTLQEMGLWMALSAAKESCKFRVYPTLTVGAGKENAGQSRFDFLYVARGDNRISLSEGQLLLSRPKGLKSTWTLRPVLLNDAISCLALLDCPNEAVSRWASGILSILAEDEVRAYLQARGRSSSATEKRNALKRAIARSYRQEE